MNRGRREIGAMGAGGWTAAATFIVGGLEGPWGRLAGFAGPGRPGTPAAAYSSWFVGTLKRPFTRVLLSPQYSHWSLVGTSVNSKRPSIPTVA